MMYSEGRMKHAHLSSPGSIPLVEEFGRRGPIQWAMSPLSKTARLFALLQVLIVAEPIFCCITSAVNPLVPDVPINFSLSHTP